MNFEGDIHVLILTLELLGCCILALSKDVGILPHKLAHSLLLVVILVNDWSFLFEPLLVLVDEFGELVLKLLEICKNLLLVIQPA